ncbi:MAG: glycosyltransferase [Acidithiobacillus sp.]
MDQAAVYIILLNWNSAADTLRCLRALTLLRGLPARVVVVDNGSEPADLERLRSGIARWGLAVELVETGENLGVGGGCNVGIRLALEQGAELVWLLNNDAVPHPDALQAMLRVMERGGRSRRWAR